MYFSLLLLSMCTKNGGTTPTPRSGQGEKLTFVLDDFAGDAYGSIGGHLFGPESSTFITHFAEFGGAIFGSGLSAML